MAGEQSLIERACRGEESALQELFEQHRGDVTRMVFRVMGPDPDVEDVVQDAFIHVYRSIRSFRGESKFSTWLYRVVTNVARMHLRKRRSRPRTVDAPVPEIQVMGPEGGPDTLTQRNRSLRTLYRHIDALSEKKRTVLVLHDLSGLPPKEIAEIVGAPVLTVRTRLFYARKELYEALGRDPELSEDVRAALAEALR